MNKYKAIILLLTVCLSLGVVNKARAFWIWTPETKRWINPKYSPKENARLQLEVVEKYYKNKQYPQALTEARRLVSYYPKAREAAEGQYYAGLCLEALSKYYDAFKAYQLVIDKYPFSERISEIVKRQYDIGGFFLEGKAVQSIDSVLLGDEPAIEIFKKVIDNAPYSEFASASQYKLGLSLLTAKRFYEAKDAFQNVIDDYPNSEWIEPAKYQIALVTAKLSGGFAYSQDNTVSARKQFEDFVKVHPDAELSQEAKNKISQLKLEEAEGNFNIARFYEKQNAKSSAKLYYQYVIENFPESNWAKKANERLLFMEKKR